MLTTTFVEGIIVNDEGINQEGVIKVGKAILHVKNTATDKHIQVSLKLKLRVPHKGPCRSIRSRVCCIVNPAFR